MTKKTATRESYPRPTIIGSYDDLPSNVPIGERIGHDYHEKEVEHVFRRSWLLIGHAGDVSEPGKFFVIDIPTFKASVIVTRDKSGKLHAFHNVCRHRGNRLVQTENGETQGKGSRFTCGFHGWTYANDGCLIGVPEEVMFPEFDKSCFGLVPVHVADWGGLIFAYFGDEPHVSLAEWMGELSDGFDNYFGDMVRIGALQAELDCNWNIALDAFSEGYHAAFLHRNTVLNFFPPSTDASAAPVAIMPTVITSSLATYRDTLEP